MGHPCGWTSHRRSAYYVVMCGPPDDPSSANPHVEQHAPEVHVTSPSLLNTLQELLDSYNADEAVLFHFLMFCRERRKRREGEGMMRDESFY